MYAERILPQQWNPFVAAPVGPLLLILLPTDLKDELQVCSHGLLLLPQLVCTAVPLVLQGCHDAARAVEDYAAGQSFRGCRRQLDLAAGAIAQGDAAAAVAVGLCQRGRWVQQLCVAVKVLQLLP